jgi:flavin-dependent dehydrogenase
VQLREPDVVLERTRLIKLLADQVRKAGGQLLLDHRFQGMREYQDFPLVRFQNGRGPEDTPADAVIGADGVTSALAADVSRDDGERVGIVQARVALPADLTADTVRCWFDRESTRFFYWLIPESDETGAVGLIDESEEAAEEALEGFLAAHGMVPIEYQQAQVSVYRPGYRPAAHVGHGQALLVGDAAGQVKMTTVGGVVTGMRGGAAAARSILRGTSYQAEARGLRSELRVHAGLRLLLDGFRDADYDRLLRLLNGPTRRVLRRYNRDELRRSIWRLVLAQPRWITLGAQAFVQAIVTA